MQSNKPIPLVAPPNISKCPFPVSNADASMFVVVSNDARGSRNVRAESAKGR